jgi:hypothetical protein
MLIIYRYLHRNDISVIEDKANIHINNILCNLELFQYNVFIFLFRKNTQRILINVAMYNDVVWKWVQ